MTYPENEVVIGNGEIYEYSLQAAKNRFETIVNARLVRFSYKPSFTACIVQSSSKIS